MVKALLFVLKKCNKLFYLHIIILFAGSTHAIFCQSLDRQIFDIHFKEKKFQKPSSADIKILPSDSNQKDAVNITTSKKIAKVLPTQFGVNTTFRNGPDQRSRSHLYKDVVTTLRFPAGSGSNTYFFDGIIPANTETIVDNTGTSGKITAINGLANSAMTPATFVQFKNDVNGVPIIVVNYFYARYGITSSGTRAERVRQAADYAASFVRRVNIDLKGAVRYWSIGNECYGKWESGFNVANPQVGIVTGKEYGEDFRVFVEKMKAVDPSIKIGAVVYHEDGDWNRQVLPEVKNHVDFLDVHNYFTADKDATLKNLLDATGQIKEIKQMLENGIVTYTGRPKDYYPITMTEFNARGPYNTTMINAVFLTQILGELVKNGFGLSSLWVSEWKWDESQNESKSFLSKDDPLQADYTARPAYLPYYYFNKMFGDQMVETVSSNQAIKSYASTFSSGETSIVLINTSATAQSVSLNIDDGTKKIEKIYWYEMYSNTVEPTTQGYRKFWVNDKTSSTSGGGPTDLNAVKPYESEYKTGSYFSIKPYSVIFLTTTTAVVEDNIYIWDGGGDNKSWTDPKNWDTDVLPSDTALVEINKNATISSSTTAKMANLKIGQKADVTLDLNMQIGNGVSDAHAITFNSGAKLNLGSGSTDVSIKINTPASKQGIAIFNSADSVTINIGKKTTIELYNASVGINMANKNAVVNNEGKVIIGSTVKTGIRSSGSFTNKKDGQIEANQPATDGIAGDGGSISNEGKITINKAADDGIELLRTSFSNAGTVTITLKDDASSGNNGLALDTMSTLNNAAAGQIDLTGGPSANARSIQTGETSSLMNAGTLKVSGMNTGSGIHTRGTLINAKGGIIDLKNTRILVNTGSLTNNGYIKAEATGNGIFGDTLTTVTNNAFFSYNNATNFATGKATVVDNGVNVRSRLNAAKACTIDLGRVSYPWKSGTTSLGNSTDQGKLTFAPKSLTVDSIEISTVYDFVLKVINICPEAVKSSSAEDIKFSQSITVYPSLTYNGGQIIMEFTDEKSISNLTISLLELDGKLIKSIIHKSTSGVLPFIVEGTPGMKVLRIQSGTKTAVKKIMVME